MVAEINDLKRKEKEKKSVIKSRCDSEISEMNN